MRWAISGGGTVLRSGPFAPVDNFTLVGVKSLDSLKSFSLPSFTGI